MAKRDLLTIGYNVSGKAFRSSALGKFTKFAVTNPASKAIRDAALSKTPEHYKRFAQYLTGGTRGDVTKLPKEVIQDIAIAKFQGQHDTASGMLTTYNSVKPEYQKDVDDAMANYGNSEKAKQFWKDFTSEEGQKKYWTSANVRTYGSIGNAHLKDNKDGTSTLRDIYDVDHDKDYKPLRGVHSDLIEGGKFGSRVYDAAKWLGIASDFKYNVKIKNKDLKINKKTKGQ
jgi:hypothetical protein